MKWIKITDELPEPLIDILIYGECICQHKGCSNIGEKKVWCGYIQRCNDEFLTLENRCEIAAEYWMPLPLSPDIQQEDEKCLCGCEDDGEKPISPEEIKEFIKANSGINDELINPDYREQYKKDSKKEDK